MKTVKISPAVAEVIAAATIDGNSLRLVGTLGRSLYVETNRTLELLGGKWNKKAKAHIFPTDPHTLIAAALGDGEVVDIKKSWEQFDTPHDLARRMAGMAGIGKDDHVLEPSAGTGNLLLAVGPEHPHSTAIEIDPERCTALAKTIPAARVTCCDFLLWARRSAETFNVVLMNPPFSKNQDIRHIIAAWPLIRPGGRLVAITSPHWTFANNKGSREFRDNMTYLQQNERAQIEALPKGTFKEMGTEVGSFLIVLTK